MSDLCISVDISKDEELFLCTVRMDKGLGLFQMRNEDPIKLISNIFRLILKMPHTENLIKERLGVQL